MLNIFHLLKISKYEKKENKLKKTRAFLEIENSDLEIWLLKFPKKLFKRQKSATILNKH